MGGSAQGAVANLAAVRGLLADAVAIPSIRRFEGDPEPGFPLGDVKPGEWAANSLGLPPDCPVTPLGLTGNVGWSRLQWRCRPEPRAGR